MEKTGGEGGDEETSRVGNEGGGREGDMDSRRGCEIGEERMRRGDVVKRG